MNNVNIEQRKLSIAEKVVLGGSAAILALSLFGQGILVIIGIGLAIANLQGAKGVRTIPKEKETYKTNLKAKISDKTFFIIVGTTGLWIIIHLFNLLTYPPFGPLYFLREEVLEARNPGVALEDLPAKSTYGIFGVLMDSIILFMFCYVIYLRIKPGTQPAEDTINKGLSRILFVLAICITSLIHLIGHLPWELYGLSQWETGFTTIEAWIGFDKLTHMMASILITMFLAILIVNQFKKINVKSTIASLYVAVGALTAMMTIAVLWEFGEWGINLILNLGHFEDEILDAPKDLVWDFLGALIGTVIAFFDLRKTPEMEIISV
ncbi:MAG: hypothetical protein ACW99Q_10160 [Candidatus Kariarchaeaceae archaeon]|jgi:hypothetical protein